MITSDTAPTSFNKSHSATFDPPCRFAQDEWGDLVQQLVAEVTSPLSSAMVLIGKLADTGQINRLAILDLRDNVAQARDAGLAGQRLARLTAGPQQPAGECLNLTQLLRSLLNQRSREASTRGIEVQHALMPVVVIADGPLLLALLNAMVDWALSSAEASIDLKLDLMPWPGNAKLVCSFSPRRRGNNEMPPALNSLNWRLVEQTALAIGVSLRRVADAGVSVLTLEFMQYKDSTAAGGSGEQFLNALNRAKPLAGSSILIISQDISLVSQIQAAIQPMGMIIDIVPCMAEAKQFCLEGLPHAIVFESRQRSKAFERLHAELLRDVPEFCFIELFDLAAQDRSNTGVTSIERKHLGSDLPKQLMRALTQGH